MGEIKHIFAILVCLFILACSSGYDQVVVSSSDVVKDDVDVREEIDDTNNDDIDNSSDNDVDEVTYIVEEDDMNVHYVNITRKLTLEPFELEISKGDKVIWQNLDKGYNRVHLIYMIRGPGEERFNSGRMVYGDKFSWVFEEFGVYEYSDSPYAEDVGRAKIIVK